MSNKLQPVRGTRDLFGDDIEKFNAVVDVAKKVSKNYNFHEIETPIFEFSDVFERNLGETSDIVSKEVYKFEDRGGNWLTLRPEFTAGIVRAFVNNGEMQQNLPQKLFSYGPVFRYDRPQKGRYRQFHQLNIEMLGAKEATADVEVIALAYDILSRIGLGNKVTLEINSLGCDVSRENYLKALVKYLKQHEGELSEDSKVRLEKNPLRILDSKDEGDRKVLENAPNIGDFYEPEAKKFFEDVLAGLDNVGIKYAINPMLVRGLDYYTSTVFEFTTNELGAQGTVLAGGRYDKLIKSMGGGDVPAFGFGGGIERLTLIGDFPEKSIRPISIIPIGQNVMDEAFKLAVELRKEDFCIEIAHSGDVKKRMQKANKLNSILGIIIGEDEIRDRTCKLKDFDNSEERIIPIGELLNELNKLKGKLLPRS